jgi:hypothetical protein
VDLTGEEEHPPQVYSLPDPEEKDESDGEETEKDESDGEETEKDEPEEDEPEEDEPEEDEPEEDEPEEDEPEEDEPEEDEPEEDESEEDEPNEEFETQERVYRNAALKRMKPSQYVKRYISQLCNPVLGGRLDDSTQDQLVGRAIREGDDYDMIRVCTEAEFPDDDDLEEWGWYESEKSEKWEMVEAFYETGRKSNSSFFVELLIEQRVDLFCKHVENGGRVDWNRVLRHVVFHEEKVDKLRYVTEKYLWKISVEMITKWAKFAERDGELPDRVEILLKAKQRKTDVLENTSGIKF